MKKQRATTNYQRELEEGQVIIDTPHARHTNAREHLPIHPSVEEVEQIKLGTPSPIGLVHGCQLVESPLDRLLSLLPTVRIEPEG